MAENPSRYYRLLVWWESRKLDVSEWVAGMAWYRRLRGWQEL